MGWGVPAMAEGGHDRESDEEESVSSRLKKVIRRTM